MVRASLSAVFRRKGSWRLGFAFPILLIALVFAIFGESIAPYAATGYDYRNILSSPSVTHWMGTDELGRDIFSRLIAAARASVVVSVAATLLSSLAGTLIGLAVVRIGGFFERMVGSLSDILIALPDIFFAILIMSLVAPSLSVLTLTIGVIYVPQFIKIVSTMASSIDRMEFVMAARSMGASPTRTLFSDVLPNILPIIVVKVTLTISSVMLLEASLSFLGLGAPPPVTSWGQMIGSLKPYIFNNPVPIVFPAITIFLVIMAVNVFGDWMQDYLNPSVKK